MPGLLDMPNEVLESIFLDAAYHGSSLDADICLSLSEPKRRLESSSLSVISRKTQDLAVSVLWKHLRVVATSVEDINRLISLVDGTFFNEDEESLDVNEQWMLRRRPKGHLVSHLSLHHLYDQHQVFGYQTMCTLMLSCNNMRFLTIRDSTVPNTPSLVRCLLTIAPRLTTFYTDFTSSTTLNQPQSIFDEKEYFDSLMGACSQLRYFSIRPQSSLDICADPDLSRPLDLFDFSTSAIDPGTYSMIVKAVSHAKAVSINFNIDDQFYEETSFPLKDVLNEILEAKSDELKSLTLAHQICPIYVTLPSRSRLCRTTFPSLTSLTLMGECFCRIYINNPQILYLIHSQCFGSTH